VARPPYIRFLVLSSGGKWVFGLFDDPRRGPSRTEVRPGSGRVRVVGSPLGRIAGPAGRGRTRTQGGRPRKPAGFLGNFRLLKQQRQQDDQGDVHEGENPPLSAPFPGTINVNRFYFINNLYRRG